VRRTVWIGVGVVGTVFVLRWLRRQRERMSPALVGASVGEGVRDLRVLVRASLAEGRKAMREKEAEIRASLEEHD
jgi:hypothetical protein